MVGFQQFLISCFINALLSNGQKWTNEPNCGLSFTNRIIGGTMSAERKYPWIVRLGFSTNIQGRYRFLCGGTLISKKFVLTAAHCLDSKDSIAVVRLGETSILCNTPNCQDPRVQQVLVKKEFKHPSFSRSNAYADIALLELGHPVQYTDYVRPICLVNQELAKIGSKGIAAGYGMEDYITREKPNGLKEILMTIIPGDECRKRFPNSDFKSKNFICAGGKVGEDTCNGDSGGPLMQVFNFGNGPRMHLLGTTSFGSSQCGVGIPGIFTSIDFHWNWIMTNVQG